MTKEIEFLEKQGYTQTVKFPDGREIEPTFQRTTVAQLLKQYADQETERLKAELEAKDKEINKHLDISFALQSELNKINSKHVTEITMRNKRINDLEYKLSELKERHMNWIKTSEQKPPREPNVRYSNPKMIVWYKGKITMLCFNHEHECWDGEDGDDYCCDIESVEYWMPLPSKPSVG